MYIYIYVVFFLQGGHLSQHNYKARFFVSFFKVALIHVLYT